MFNSYEGCNTICPKVSVRSVARHPFASFIDVVPAFVVLFVQLSVAADERELYIYVTQSFKEFEQAVFAKACERRAIARGRAEDAEPRGEGTNYPHRDGPLLSEFSDAMVAGLQENIIAFEGLEESVDR